MARHSLQESCLRPNTHCHYDLGARK